MPEEPNQAGNRSGGAEWRGFAQLAAIVLLIVVAVLFARAPGRVERGAASGLAPESVRPTVRVMHPSPTDQALTVELTGTVNLEERVRVASEVVGRIAWVSPDFSNGGSIRANETFIRVDPAEFELEVEAAEMAVREAEADVWIERSAGEGGHPGVRAREPGSRAVRVDPPAAVDCEGRSAAPEGAGRSEAGGVASGAHEHLPAVRRPGDGLGRRGRGAGGTGGAGRRACIPPGHVYRPGALQVDVPIEPRDLEYLDPVIGRVARGRRSDGDVGSAGGTGLLGR